jgi:hypothetical protein
VVAETGGLSNFTKKARNNGALVEHDLGTARAPHHVALVTQQHGAVCCGLPSCIHGQEDRSPRALLAEGASGTRVWRHQVGLNSAVRRLVTYSQPQLFKSKERLAEVCALVIEHRIISPAQTNIQFVTQDVRTAAAAHDCLYGK